MIRVNLTPAEPYRDEHYGVTLQSATQHRVTGRGVHNPEFNHRIDVWDNSRRLLADVEVPRLSKPASEGDLYVDPYGFPTAERYSLLVTAQASCIVAEPAMRDTTPQGQPLALGDVVELAISGYVMGEFVVTARPLHDPHLERVS